MTRPDYEPWESDPERDDWIEHRDFMEQERIDRLIRHGDSFTACVVCNQKPGKLIYGVKCQGCFEAQREEREAA